MLSRMYYPRVTAATGLKSNFHKTSHGANRAYFRKFWHHQKSKELQWGKKVFDPLLILYVCPLTQKWSVYNFNGRFIWTVRDRITTTNIHNNPCQKCYTLICIWTHLLSFQTASGTKVSSRDPTRFAWWSQNTMSGPLPRPPPGFHYRPTKPRVRTKELNEMIFHVHSSCTHV
jgi:hypothetical protein